MGCNCGQGRAPITPPAPAPTPPANPHTHGRADGVQTSGAAGNTQTFTLTSEGGRTQQFGSYLEAAAALVRNGGRGRIS